MCTATLAYLFEVSQLVFQGLSVLVGELQINTAVGHIMTVLNAFCKKLPVGFAITIRALYLFGVFRALLHLFGLCQAPSPFLFEIIQHTTAPDRADPWRGGCPRSGNA